MRGGEARGGQGEGEEGGEAIHDADGFLAVVVGVCRWSRGKAAQEGVVSVRGMPIFMLSSLTTRSEALQGTAIFQLHFRDYMHIESWRLRKVREISAVGLELF